MDEVASQAHFHASKNVYIWDMDETLILLKSLLDGSFASSFHGLKDTRIGVELGKRWENIILQVCDDYFFYKSIENYNEPCLHAVSEYDDGKDLSDYDFGNDCLSSPYDDSNKRKLAYRHRVIGEKYAKGFNNVADQVTIEAWKELYDSTDVYTDGWLSAGRDTLLHALGMPKAPIPNALKTSCIKEAKHGNVNIVVTSGSLIPSLVKCLLYRLDDAIFHDNVYSSWEVGKLQCFKWIKQRFNGPKVKFCVIGDGFEENEASQVMGWPFVRVDFRPSNCQRFPGLTMGIIQGYMETVYGPLLPRAEVEDDDG